MSTSSESWPNTSVCRSSAIRSWVSVPVLSVHSTSIAPKFWIASSRLTMTFRRASSTAPLASVEVTIIGSISGVRPTATDSANRNASIQSPLVKPLISSTNGTITKAKRISSQLTLLTPAWNAVGAWSPTVTRWATVPKQVSWPVATTSAMAVPETTFVPMNSRLFCSSAPPSSLLASANFSTGSDSPVIAAWATNRSLATSTRQSAGIMSPADSTM